MKNSAKLVLAFMLLLAFPMKQWAQNPQLTKVGEFNIHSINNIEERVVILHSIQASDVFSYIYNEAEDRFDIYAPANYTCEDSNVSPDFDNFLSSCNDEWVAFNSYDKDVRGALYVQWRYQLEDNVFQAINEDFIRLMKNRDDNATCDGAFPFCTDNGLYTFPAGTNSGSPCGTTYNSSCGEPYMCSGTPGQSANCLYTAPNPAFYYMRIADPGNLNIHMQSTPSVDIDFDCWGPFSDINTACSQLSCSNIVDCGYSTSATENCHINNAQTGQYYILLITNYSNSTCNIAFSNTGTGTTDCSILPPLVDGGGPYCVGETIQLTANGQAGASYHWTGPGFSSNLQNPTITNCTLSNAGEYTCTITIGNQSNNATTEAIVVYAQPTADFTSTTVCAGNATQFTSTSTTNPSGQSISSYEWNFGDGQSGTGQNTTHTYAQPGTYQATLTVSTGNGHCTSAITKTVTVNAMPTASFTSTTVCQGNATQFTSTSTGAQINSYQWNFGDNQTGSGQTTSHTYTQPGTYQATLTVQTSAGCSHSITQTVTVNQQPTADFIAENVCQGNPMVFTSTSTGDQINSYQWNFGDGQTGTGQTVSHTYAQAGNYPVTLNVQTPSSCADDITQTVSVYAQPVASATATPATINYGASTTLSANAGTQGTFDFHWEPANMVANPNSQTTQTVPLQQTQTYTVTITNPQGGCSSTAQVIVSLEGSSLVAMASADQTDLCDGESTTLHAIPSGGDIDHYSFSWSPASSLSSTTSQNPVATPGLGNTTYTCHVSDGFTDLDVSVTIHVHPNVEHDIYQTICENEPYSFFGQDVLTPGVYDHTLHTQYGCDSILHLHLENWPIYETSVFDHFCQNDTYTFFDQSISEAGVYYHTLNTVNGCDSTIRLNLTQDPAYEFEYWESTCEGGPGYNYNGQFYQPSSQPYIFNLQTTSNQCDSTIILHVEESAYNSKTYNVSLCGTEFTWASNGITYYESGVYRDTLHFDDTCDSTLVLYLELRPNYYDDVVASSCDEYRWKNDDYFVDMTFTESTVYTHHYTNAYGCESTATLYLTISNHDEVVLPMDEACDEYFWDPMGHVITYTDHAGDHYTLSGTYHRTYLNQAECDSLVTMSVEMEYTPNPTEIMPVDLNNTAPHWVVTSSEFQINTYDFSIWDHNPLCHWDSIHWQLENTNVSWFLEPDETTNPVGKNCKLYVLEYVQDTVWIHATVYNRCSLEGQTKRYWFISSFYGLNDQSESQADFSVIPNPNNGQMTLSFDNFSGKVAIKVYDMRGTLIDNFETHNDNTFYTLPYNMKGLSDGVYLFVATGKEGTIAKKVVIRR